jgi:hypothetical protein
MRRNKTRKMNGGNCTDGVCQLGGANCKIGVMFPKFGGGKRKSIKGGNCGCGSKQPMMELPAGVSLGPLTANIMKGAGCGCGSAPPKPPATSELLRGGACPCQAVPKLPTALGGYRATKRNLKYLRKYKRGIPIGFTMRSSLKAKGLIPRANGKKRVSAKYRK